ncbi:MAG: TauD/TfdA dioxygenase family protein [Minwuia sp.]|uniref:TauD/TfdA dioxygenase family protein n=1 Tax=Minwuia sp. TaxID=2493630 RepID=UPI003A87C4D4
MTMQRPTVTYQDHWKTEGYDTIDVRPVTPVVGAEVHGVDLTVTPSGKQLEEIKRAFLAHHVLAFPDQNIDREQHKAFGRLFGTLHVHPLKHDKNKSGGNNGLSHIDPEHPLNQAGSEDPDPEILEIKTTRNSKYTAGGAWHADVTCDERPPMGSMLLIKQVPEVGCGGDTCFTNMYRAFDTLSDSMKDYLRTLTAVHDGAIPYIGAYNTVAPDGGYPRNEHPVIVRHPETGRELLYVNPGFTSHIVGLTRFESKHLLEMLYRHVESRLDLQVRMSYRPNTLMFWDNRCLQHQASWDYWPYSRYGERVSIIGHRPAREFN